MALDFHDVDWHTEAERACDGKHPYGRRTAHGVSMEKALVEVQHQHLGLARRMKSAARHVGPAARAAVSIHFVPGGVIPPTAAEIDFAIDLSDFVQTHDSNGQPWRWTDP